MSALPRTLRYFAATFLPVALLIVLGARYVSDLPGPPPVTTIALVLLAVLALGAWRLALALDAKADALERLEGYATTDALTGLENRRIFMERLNRHWAEFRRRPALSVGVVAMDLDFFKRVNDAYGRGAGDAVLRHFARIVRESLRETDTAGRVGGEEFSVILPGSDMAGARTYAERVRRRLETEPAAWGTTPIVFTVSIGACSFLPTDRAAETALERADEALYRAKANGRNRVEVGESPIRPAWEPASPAGSAARRA